MEIQSHTKSLISSRIAIIKGLIFGYCFVTITSFLFIGFLYRYFSYSGFVASIFATALSIGFITFLLMPDTMKIDKNSDQFKRFIIPVHSLVCILLIVFSLIALTVS